MRRGRVRRRGVFSITRLRVTWRWLRRRSIGCVIGITAVRGRARRRGIVTVMPAL